MVRLSLYYENKKSTILIDPDKAFIISKVWDVKMVRANHFNSSFNDIHEENER